MIVYFSGSARDIKKKAPIYLDLLDTIQSMGGIMTNSWVQGALLREGLPQDLEWWERICSEAEKGIEDADVLIVEGSGASAFGVGYEVSYALSTGKPSLLLIAQDEETDSYAYGVRHPKLETYIYTRKSLRVAVERFLKKNLS